MPFQNNIKAMNKTKQLVLVALLVAQAIILSYFERYIPFNILIPIPNAKIGLANIITLISIYILPFHLSIAVVLLKSIMTSVLFSSLSGLLYSITGGLLSYIVMYMMVKYLQDYFTGIGISVVGAICHNFGQVLVASLIVQNVKVMMYLPILMIASITTGVVVGIASERVVKLVKTIL